MASSMLDYPSLAAVGAVIREGTFERAAAALGMTPSAVSQRVKGLEERLGAILVIRGQPCLATDLGRTLCAHLDRVRLLEADLEPTLVGNSGGMPVRLTIRLAVNADSLATWFPQAAAAFARGTGIALDLMVEDESHTADLLRSGEVLGAVTADPASVQGCKTIELGTSRYAACASPSFVERHFGAGVNGSTVSTAPHLRFDRRDMLQVRWAAEAHGTELTGPTHWVPSTHGFLDMALAGLAWGLHTLPLAEPHLATGDLVELSPGLRIEVKLYWMVARLHAASLHRLTEAVCAAATRSLIA
jgi:LysR family transcriptional regulator, chromosome initiation inhibitor